MAKPVYVTQPFLPPLEEFTPYLQEIWESKILTNGGAFHQQLEHALCEYLGVEFLALVTNGTIGLVTALQALRIAGEVITTPYSFVATAHALLWNGIKPVFVDIDPVSLNIDPKKIEAAVTKETTAILAVHCYGRPCDVESVQAIARKYNLRVIYDAAHAFGVRNDRGSILNYGDLSVLSFHATKVFNTFEGGAIICPDAATKRRVDNLKNFGFTDEVTVVEPGINGKMSEFNSALGLLQLKYVDQAITSRAQIDQTYREHLAGVRGITCLEPVDKKASSYSSNYSYFPILVNSDYALSRDGLYERLKSEGIFSRRYFYPLISDFPMYRGLPSAQRCTLPIAASISDRVLCLPIYPALQPDELKRVIDLIKNNLR
jgi:dTDP-4-amino-4,6-dideoxygalactose transaminase